MGLSQSSCKRVVGFGIQGLAYKMSWVSWQGSEAELHEKNQVVRTRSKLDVMKRRDLIFQEEEAWYIDEADVVNLW